MFGWIRKSTLAEETSLLKRDISHLKKQINTLKADNNSYSIDSYQIMTGNMFIHISDNGRLIPCQLTETMWGYTLVHYNWQGHYLYTPETYLKTQVEVLQYLRDNNYRRLRYMDDPEEKIFTKEKEE